MKILKLNNNIIHSFTDESSNEAIVEWVQDQIENETIIQLELNEAHSCEATLSGMVIDISGDEDYVRLNIESKMSTHLPITKGEGKGILSQALDLFFDQGEVDEKKYLETKKILEKL